MRDLRVDLSGKIAIVTGASRGIGEGIAFGFAESGATVVLASRNLERLENVAHKIVQMGGEARAYKVDVTREEDVKSLVEAVSGEFGRIDILVNNAGVIVRKRAEEHTTQDWDLVLHTNLRGAFWCGREVAKVMIAQRKGKIINIASVMGVVARPTISAYAASKAALIQLTKAWAVEWAPYNINVNAIAPGFIETEMTEPLRQNREVMKYVLDRTPLRRLGQVDDIVGAALFLASEAASYITGHCLAVDGGWLAK